MAPYGFNPRRRRRREDGSRPRSLGCVWPIFWLILLIVLLGLIFGGYRKGTKDSSQPELVGPCVLSSGSVHGSGALHSLVP
jgi:hypothetical protein